MQFIGSNLYCRNSLARNGMCLAGQSAYKKTLVRTHSQQKTNRLHFAALSHASDIGVTPRLARSIAPSGSLEIELFLGR
jgi:hypothetical protein